MLFRTTCCLWLLLPLGLTGCGQGSQQTTNAPKEPASVAANAETVSSGKAETAAVSTSAVSVVATFSILADWVQEVGGDAVSVSTLVGPGGDAHTYEPTPQDAVAVSDSPIVFEMGLGFETWLDALMSSTQSKASRIVVTQGISVRVIPEHDGHAESDPHLWHDPVLVVECIRNIQSGLQKAIPGKSSEIQARADAYVKELEALNAAILKDTLAIPEEHRRLLTTHDTFGYFAERYGFRVTSVLGSISSEIADPSAAQIAEIIDLIRREKVPAVFTENILNPQLTQQVASEAGVTVVPSLFTDALGPQGSPGDSYLKMMRSNVDTIVKALR